MKRQIRNVRTVVLLLLLWASISGGQGVAADGEAVMGPRDYGADLASPVVAVRVQAAVELGRDAEKAATMLLLPALKDREPAVRREAAKALGAIKDGRAVPALIEALRDDDTNVRMYAAYALGEIKDVRAADELLRAVRDAQWCVRDHAAWALRELRDPSLAEKYAALLQDEAVEVSTATWILRGLGDEVALKAVTALLRAPRPATRLRAVRALRELKAAAVESLLGALDDPDAAVRRRVVEALARTPGPEVKQALTARLAAEPDASVRAAIERLLNEAYPPAEVAAWWSFDDQNAQTARDVTGRGNDGEIRRCAPVPGKVGAALKFGDGSCVSLGKVPKLPMANQPLTVMAWVKSDADRGVVVARGGAFCGYSLYLLDGVAKFGIHREQDGPIYIAVGREPVGGDWVHLAGVIQSDRIELYVNGKLAAQTKTDGLMPGNAGQGMEIGGDLGNSAVEITDSFNGIIDEVKVFLTALSEEEIAEQCGKK
ncbi:MAG TPA: HEAT repeat domain-containing protein [Candidatus Anammoximicrobium sp.]|nr:HEAT repeat domain-containing protein [Candidatus Anammoximicrobium sp.]